MIRRAVASDAPEIAETHVLSWQHTYKGMVPDDYLAGLSIPVRTERWKERFSSSKGATFVAEQNGRVVGFVDFGPCRDKDKDSEETGELYAIYVRPEAKGAGVGRSLFHRGKLWSREQGFTELTTLVLEANQGARDFYFRMGMIEDGTKVPDKIGGQDVVEVRYAMKLR